MSKAEKIEELQNILSQDSSNLSARRKLAILLLDSGYADEALLHLLYLSKATPDDSGIFYNLGIACEKLKKYPEAKEAYEKAIELSPEELDASYNLGLVLTELQDYDSAIECFNKVLAKDPKDSNSYFNLGICYLKKDDQVNALMNFQSTIELNDEDIYAHFYIGNIYKDMGEIETAFAEFNKVLELSPDYSWAYYNLAVIFWECGQAQDAVNCLEKTIELNPKDVDAYITYAKILSAHEQYENAEAKILEAIQNCGNNGNLFYIMAQIQKHLQNRDESLKYFNLALENSGTLNTDIKFVNREIQTLG